MLLKRPEAVIFDPSIKEHRVAVRQYMKRKAWSDSPLKFAHDPAFGSVADAVQFKLLQWYLDQEETRDKKRAERVTEKPTPKAKPALVEVKKTSPEGIPRMLMKA
jgi:hypothetical protein